MPSGPRQSVSGSGCTRKKDKLFSAFCDLESRYVGIINSIDRIQDSQGVQGIPQGLFLVRDTLAGMWTKTLDLAHSRAVLCGAPLVLPESFERSWRANDYLTFCDLINDEKIDGEARTSAQWGFEGLLNYGYSQFITANKRLGEIADDARSREAAARQECSSDENNIDSADNDFVWWGRLREAAEKASQFGMIRAENMTGSVAMSEQAFREGPSAEDGEVPVEDFENAHSPDISTFISGSQQRQPTLLSSGPMHEFALIRRSTA